MRAFSEERRASARRGEAPLVLRSFPHAYAIQVRRHTQNVVHPHRQELTAEKLGSPAHDISVVAEGRG